MEYNKCPSPASVRCSDCGVPFCTECDQQHHAKRVALHQRQALEAPAAAPAPATAPECSRCDAKAVFLCQDCPLRPLLCRSCDPILHASKTASHVRARLKEPCYICDEDAVQKCLDCAEDLSLTCVACSSEIHKGKWTSHRLTSLETKAAPQEVKVVPPPKVQVPDEAEAEAEAGARPWESHSLFEVVRGVKGPDDHPASRVYLIAGDSTTLKVDAIVNAANSSLLGGSGIDGAIHNGAGPLLREYNRLHHKGCKVGEAVLSPGFNLPCSWVISTVGPHGTDDDRSKKLVSCYNSILEIVDRSFEGGFDPFVRDGRSFVNQHTSAGFEPGRMPIRSVAFCSISTGIFGYDPEEATSIAIKTVKRWAAKSPNSPSVKLIFVTQGEAAYRRYMRYLARYFLETDQ